MKKLNILCILLVMAILMSGIITGCARLFGDPAQRHFNQGQELYRQDRLDEAIDEYTEAIRLNPKHAQAYYHRGLAYDFLHQLEQAIEDYDQSISLDPNFIEAYVNQGSYPIPIH